MGDHFQASEPAWLAVTGGQGEASVPNKFHDHPDHVLVRKKSQQFAGETTVPDSVISSSQIDKYGTSLHFCLKRILNVLRQQNDLIYGGIPVSKSSLFFWKQGVDYWLNGVGSMVHHCRSVVREFCKGRRAERLDSSSAGSLRVLKAKGSRIPALFTILLEF